MNLPIKNYKVDCCGVYTPINYCINICHWYNQIDLYFDQIICNRPENQSRKKRYEYTMKNRINGDIL